MKKMLVLVISLILILSCASLAYAGEDASAPQPDPASQESHEEPQQESQLESLLESLQESNRESGHESDQPACTLHPTPVIQNGEQIGSMDLR